MTARFKRVREKLGLPDDLYLYTFKHKGNIDAHLTKGISLLQIKEKNRHSSLEITDRYMRRMLKQADPMIRDMDMEL